MKIVMRLLILLATVVMLAGATQASESSWRISIKPDSTAGVTGPTTTLGVASSSSSNTFSFPDQPAPIAPIIGTGGTLLSSQILENTSAYPRVWSLRVVGSSNFSGPVIRLNFSTINDSTVPPQTVLGGKSARLVLKMVDNKGVGGAPANGTEWNLPIPTAHSATSFFNVELPTLSITTNSSANVMSQGYFMEFRQDVVPEPSSIMALGLGISGLLAFRKRAK